MLLQAIATRSLFPLVFFPLSFFFRPSVRLSLGLMQRQRPPGREKEGRPKAYTHLPLCDSVLSSKASNNWMATMQSAAKLQVAVRTELVAAAGLWVTLKKKHRPPSKKKQNWKILISQHQIWIVSYSTFKSLLSFVS